jgi:hypothetical protein
MDVARANADESIWDYSVIMAVTIDRPAKDVWPYLFGHKKDIWTEVQYTAIGGESEKVGEIYTDANPFHGAQLFYEAIKVMPEKQLVLKITYRKDPRDERRLTGYDFVALNEVAGRTTVFFQQAFALPVDAPKHDLNLESAQHDKELADIFQNLKKVVENRQ